MSKRKKIILGILSIIGLIYLIPQQLQMPVKGASKSDYNSRSFWFYPWGKSVTHKGVDIFAKKGTEINSATHGIVLYAGHINRGGKSVIILGPKWRLHYYAHMDTLQTTALSFVNHTSSIGTVGTSGNAVGKQPHLHYAIMTMIPYIWNIDSEKQGWKKMFYLNPIDFF